MNNQDKKLSKEDEEKIVDLLRTLPVNYYGKLVINFQNGKAVNCIKEESIKL